MLGEQAKYNQLMSALNEHLSVKAALIIDASGNTRLRVGAARSVLGGAKNTDKMLVEDLADAPRESVYLTGAGEDFLLVVFDDAIEFDGIKHYVDSLIRDLEL